MSKLILSNNLERILYNRKIKVCVLILSLTLVSSIQACSIVVRNNKNLDNNNNSIDYEDELIDDISLSNYQKIK